MNEEIKKKWIAALRGTEYIQGHVRLRDDGEYCCLGVLCDIFSKETKRGEWILPDNDYGGYYFRCHDGKHNDISTVRLPQDVMEWAEIEDSDPSIRLEVKEGNDTVIFYLTDANDSLEYSFERIADVVERGRILTMSEAREEIQTSDHESKS